MTRRYSVSPEKRALIVRLLKEHDGAVSTVAELTQSAHRTVRIIRDQEGIPPRQSGLNRLQLDPAIEAAIIADLSVAGRSEGDELIAARYGLKSKSTVTRIRRRLGIEGLPQGSASPALDATEATRERIAQRDEVSRLKAEIKRLHREELSDAAIKEILGRVRDAPVERPEWLVAPPKPGKKATEVPMTIWSDWHLPEVVSLSETAGINEYNPEIAERRIRALVTNIIHLCREHHSANYPGIVVNLLGDFVSGGIHPELAKTDAEEVIPAALRCRDILVWALEEMASAFGRVYVPCAAGNHGRTTQKPEYKGYVYKNFDWLIYQLLARHFEGRKTVVIDVPDTNEVHYRVFGHRYFAVHGDQLGVKGGDGIIGVLGPVARGEVKVGKQQAAIGRDYDVLLMGHWHQQLWLPRVVVSNTLKGYDEYAGKALRAVPTEPSQPLWFVHPSRRKTSHWDVTVEEPRKVDSEPWVSFPKR